jgi:hypothetical protein
MTLLDDLNVLVAQNPEKAREVFAAHPELTQALFGNLHKDELALKVRETDSPESFFAYCELLDGIAPPPHVQRWIRKFYEDHEKGVGTVNLASRGFRKTTYGMKFISYRVGKEPNKTYVAIGAQDDSPEKVMNSVSVIIESHPEWKRAFPNVVPDKPRGWSVEGYYVKDESIPYEDWVKQQVSVIDPTLVAGSYNSKRINGKHPTGVLYIDDIHDINNNSETQRKDVVRKLTTVILKTVVRVDDKLSTWVLGIGVPWATDDGYQTMVNAGYGFMLTPAMRRAPDGEGVYISGLNEVTGVTYEDIQGWWFLTWPENFGVRAIVQERSFGKSDFWQMIMMDIATAATGRLRFYEYPHDQISYDWPTQGGCDPTTFDENAGENKSSHFALGYVGKRPNAGPMAKAIVIDGVLEQCTLSQAENFIISAQSKFANWLNTAVENVSVGKVFYQAMRLNSVIRVVLSGLKGITDSKVRSKKDRWLNDAAKYFESGAVQISDADTPYLRALRKLFNNFFDLSEHDPAWDAGDSVYHALRQMPDLLKTENEGQRQERQQRQNRPHPLAGLSTYVGYGRKNG